MAQQNNDSRVATALENPAKTIVRVKIADLKPHPRQAHYFNDYPEVRLHELAEQIRAGLDHPIEILPDNTIVCGHKRVGAAKRLGWEEIDAVVRHDLAAEGPAAVEARLIRDNLHRSHLDALEIARSYQGLKRLEAGRGPRRSSLDSRQDLRDKIGEQLGMSGRTLDRYLRVLDTPLEVQRAFSSGKVPLITAGKVAGLASAAQQRVAQQIREGGDPAVVVAAALLGSVGKKKRWWTALNAFMCGLQRGLDALDGRLDEITQVGDGWCAVLRKARELIDQLLAVAADGSSATARAEDDAGQVDVSESNQNGRR